MRNLVVTMLLGLVACTKGARTLEEEAESLRDRMCACTDRPCADSVSEETVRFAKRLGEQMRPDERNARVEQAMDAMAACEQKLLGSGK